MCRGQATLGRFGGTRGLGWAGSAAASSPGNGFNLALQRLDLLFERNHLPQVGHRKFTKRFHLEKGAYGFSGRQTHLLCRAHGVESRLNGLSLSGI